MDFDERKIGSGSVWVTKVQMVVNSNQYNNFKIGERNEQQNDRCRRYAAGPDGYGGSTGKG
jgi:hypothetical protein